MTRITSIVSNGFTLIELVIVIAVIGLLMAVVGLPLTAFRQQQALQNSTTALVSVLNDARAKTFAALDNTSYGVALASDSITLFTGTDYNDTTATNEVYPFETPVTASWNLAGGGNTISFDRLKGTTGQYGTIILQLPNGTTRTVTVTALGSVARD